MNPSQWLKPLPYGIQDWLINANPEEPEFWSDGGYIRTVADGVNSIISSIRPL